VDDCVRDSILPALDFHSIVDIDLLLAIYSFSHYWSLHSVWPVGWDFVQESRGDKKNHVPATALIAVQTISFQRRG
jgi:hypothetical protein